MDGFFIDDFWCSNELCAADPRGRPCPCRDPVQGPSEIDSHSQADMGLSDADVREITLGWEATMAAVQNAILEHNGYTWSLMAGQANANAMPHLVSPEARACTATLRSACSAESAMQTTANLFGVAVVNATRTPRLKQDLAFFLLARGPFAWLGWGVWGMTWPFNPEPAHGELPPLPHGVPLPPELQRDYGEPLDFCHEVRPGVFARTWSKASVELDCNAFAAQINVTA